MPRPLSSATGGRTSSTLRPQWVARPARSAAAGDVAHRRSARARPGAPRQWKAMIGPLSSTRTRSERSSSPCASARLVDAALPRGGLALCSAFVPRAQQLGAVVAEVGDRSERDDLPRDRRAPAR
jgi:hypothetical protein